MCSLCTPQATDDSRLFAEKPREALIKSLLAFILEFLCNARNEAT
jgi:hypothetical protein